VFTFVCVHFNFLCSFFSSFSPPFFNLFSYFLLCWLHLISVKLFIFLPSACVPFVLFFDCLSIVLYHFHRQRKDLPLFRNRTVPVMLCLFENYFHNGLTLFSCRWRQKFAPKRRKCILHTHISPQRSVMDPLLRAGYKFKTELKYDLEQRKETIWKTKI
jgi:hypothetical protein